MLPIDSPYPQFFDLDGRPLDAGYIYVGAEDQDPKTNPITVYWDQELTQPAAQPLRTLNGIISRNGTPAFVYAATDHSMTVQNRRGVAIYYARSSQTFSLASQVNARVNELVTDLASTEPDKGSDLIGFIQSGAGAVPRTALDKMREVRSIGDFGGVGDGSSSVEAFTKAITYMNSNPETTVLLTDGDWLIDAPLPAITASYCTFVGQGDNTNLLISAEGSAFRWGADDSLQIIGGGMRDVSIEYPSAPAAGACVFDVRNASRQVWQGLNVENVGTLIRCGDVGDKPVSIQHAIDISGYVYNSGAPTFDLRYGAGFFVDDCQLYVGGVPMPVHPAAMTTVAGTNFVQAADKHWDTIYIGDNVLAERYDRGVYIYANDVVINNIWVGSAIFDFNRRGCLLFAESTGTIAGYNSTNTWYTAWEGRGISFDGPGLNTLHILDVPRIHICGAQGLYVGAAVTHMSISNPMIYATNRQGGGESSAEFLCSDFTLTGGNINFSTVSVGLPYRSPYGISVGPDQYRYAITGVTSSGTTGGFDIATNSTPSSDRLVARNVGANYSGLKTGGAFVVPASLAAWINPTAYSLDVHIHGGTVAGIGKNGANITGMTAGTLRLDPGERFVLNYTVAPNVTWFAAA